jgi:hypothetical protein
VVVEGADVTNEGSVVDNRCCPFSQGVVPISMGNFFLFESAPLVYQVVVAIITHLGKRRFNA